MTAIHPQVVHESETQRQHVRFLLPSRATLDGHEYTVRDLSTGGVALQGVKGDYAVGLPVALDLHFSFGSFSLSTRLDAQVVYHQQGAGILGCRFTSMAPEKVSLLNHAIKSYMAGDIVSAGNLLNVAARNNHTKPRVHANTNASPSLRRQLPGLFVVTVIGILLAAFITGNIYNSLFIVRAENAAVAGPLIPIRAMNEGVFRSRLDPNLTIVQQNQQLGTITPSNGAPATILQSPCNCYIAKTYAANGEAVSAGSPVMSLIRVDAKPWVMAEIDPSQAKKISTDSKASVTIFGSNTEYTGRVVGLESGLTDSRTPVSRSAVMKVMLDKTLPVDFVNRLAAVTLSVH